MLHACGYRFASTACMRSPERNYRQLSQRCTSVVSKICTIPNNVAKWSICRGTCSETALCCHLRWDCAAYIAKCCRTGPGLSKKNDPVSQLASRSRFEGDAWSFAMWRSRKHSVAVCRICRTRQPKVPRYMRRGAIYGIECNEEFQV